MIPNLGKFDLHMALLFGLVFMAWIFGAAYELREIRALQSEREAIAVQRGQPPVALDVAGFVKNSTISWSAK